MSIISLFLCMCSFVLSIVFLVSFCREEASLAKSIVKTSSVVCLVLISILQSGPWLLTFGLAFCAAGDYFLSRDGQANFLAGVGEFALGHIMFILVFWGFADGLMSHIFTLPSAVLMCVGFGVGILLWGRVGALRWPVMAYIVIIVVMGLVSFMLPMKNGLILVAWGAKLFILSDLVLSMQMFVLPKDSVLHKFTPYVVWSSYWTALLFILIGVLAV